MHSDHQEEAEGVEPESGPVSSLSSWYIQIIDSSEVLGGEEPRPRVRSHWLGYEEKSVQGRGQVCGKHKPEWVDISKTKDKTHFKCDEFNLIQLFVWENFHQITLQFKAQNNR